MFGLTPESQYIDINGKCRALNFKTDRYKVTISTKPQAPFLNIPFKKRVYEAEVDDLEDFLNEAKLSVKYQELDDEYDIGIRGLWVEAANKNIHYIPIKSGSQDIDNIEYAPATYIDPLRIRRQSELSDINKAKRVANIYKMYALYTKSKLGTKFAVKVVKNHKIDIEQLNKRLYMKDKDGLNTIMYIEEDENIHLCVPSKKIKDRLLSYIEVIESNYPDFVKNIKNISVIPNYYRETSDFTVRDKQLIFMDRDSLTRWNELKKTQMIHRTVLKVLQPRVKLPYFYTNPYILNNRILMIQNVIVSNVNEFMPVIQLIKKWNKERINDLSVTDLDEVDAGVVDNNNISLYNELGLINSVSKGKYHIIDYGLTDPKNDIIYGAILIEKK